MEHLESLRVREAELAGAEVLAEEHGELESRQVWAVVEPGHGVMVVERSYGELTQEVYDCRAHEHKVTLEWEAAVSLAESLGASPRKVAVALRAIFTAPGCCMADFMDLLDRSSIPYSYAAEAGDVIAYRPAPRLAP